MNYGIHKKTWKNRWLKYSIIALVVVILLGLVAWNRFEAWYDSSLEPIAAYGDDKLFTVTSGETADEVGANLVDVGLIQSSRAFTIYLDRTGQRGLLQVGTYRLNPAMSTDAIADIIASGDIDTRLVTILPGQTVAEIRQGLIDDGFTAQEVDAAFNKNYSHELLASKPKDATLEGYIFPESFQIDSSTSVEDILIKSFDVFWGQIDQSMLDNIEKQGLTFHEAVNLASIVGLESVDDDERKKIAQVFLKRLREDISLGADPTFRYAAELAGVEDSSTIDSPYNTRIYTGLPPGPIANFTISALTSVAEPAGTDYLFFVAGDDGVTRFSNTLEEHEALRDEHCIELCRL